MISYNEKQMFNDLASIISNPIIVNYHLPNHVSSSSVILNSPGSSFNFEMIDPVIETKDPYECRQAMAAMRTYNIVLITR